MSEEPGLYLDIQRLNPHRAEVYGVMREGLELLEKLVIAGDRERFAELLTAGRAAVKPVAVNSWMQLSPPTSTCQKVSVRWL